MNKMTLLGSIIALACLLWAGCRGSDAADSDSSHKLRAIRLEAEVDQLKRQNQTLTAIKLALEGDLKVAVDELAERRKAHEDCATRLGDLQKQHKLLVRDLADLRLVMADMSSGPGPEVVGLTMRIMESLREKAPKGSITPKEEWEYQELMKWLSSYTGRF